MTRIATWNSVRDVWETEAVSLLSGLSDVYSETFTISGSMRNGVAYEHQMSGRHMDDSGSLFSQLGGKLMPTPAASVANDGEGAGTWLARREVVKAKGINGNGMGMPLTIAVQLLPTPRSNEANGVGVHGDGGADLRTTIALLPTPTAERPDGRKSEGFAEGRANFYDIINADKWGEYAPAIARWETILMRLAPEPTEPNSKGGRRLSAAFVEWMMGLPENWVTDPALGLSRTQQLKMLGNGVVTQQAVVALRSMTKGLINAF